MSVGSIMRAALVEIAAHQCLDRTPEGDTCAEGYECAVCLATVALQDVDAEERAERRHREAQRRAAYPRVGDEVTVGDLALGQTAVPGTVVPDRVVGHVVPADPGPDRR